jgi:hypothetical protein
VSSPTLKPKSTPGASIDYEFIAERLKDVFEDFQVTKIASIDGTIPTCGRG